MGYVVDRSLSGFQHLPVDGCPIELKGAILTVYTFLKCVAALAAKAEIGALFFNAMEVKNCV